VLVLNWGRYKWPVLITEQYLVELLELAFFNAQVQEVAFPAFSPQDGKIPVSETSSATVV
jgi:hypothetical protein